MNGRSSRCSTPPSRVEHEAGADPGHPEPGLGGGAGGVLPLDADLGEEVVAGGAVLGEALVAPVAVVAHGRAGDEDGRRAIEAGHRSGEEAGGLEAAVEDLLLAGRGPFLVADPGAGEVDHGVDALEGGGVDGAGPRVPGDAVARCRRRLGPGQPRHPMPVGRERRASRTTDEPASARDHDVHDRYHRAFQRL